MSEYEAIVRALSQYEVDESGCWLWKRARDKNGYGRFTVCDMQWRAHRAAYMVHVDDLDPTMVVMHMCDTPSCINPEHLRLGTQRENIMDAVAKGRMGCDGKVAKMKTVVC